MGGREGEGGGNERERERGDEGRKDRGRGMEGVTTSSEDSGSRHNGGLCQELFSGLCIFYILQHLDGHLHALILSQPHLCKQDNTNLY